jgi:hypothetical protein
VLVKVAASTPFAVIVTVGSDATTLVSSLSILVGVAHIIPVPVETSAWPVVPVVPPAVNEPVIVVLVNRPVDAVVAPILMLLIVPSVAGFIVTAPVPVGLNTTLAFAGLIATAPLLAVNAPPTVSAFLTVVVPVV